MHNSNLSLFLNSSIPSRCTIRKSKKSLLIKENKKVQGAKLTRKLPLGSSTEVFDLNFIILPIRSFELLGVLLLNMAHNIDHMIEEGEIKVSKQQTRVVSLREWACKSLHQRYTLKKQIGQGAYGSVYEACRLEDNKRIAIKKMQNFQQKEDKEGKSFGFPITTLREIKLLQHLEHPNILNINDVVFERLPRSSHRSPIIYLCLDLMDSDLGYLVRDQQYKFSPYRIQQICKQLLQGLAYLHSKNVAHRDLKPANILINSEGVVKVADFGLAKKLSKFSTTLVVTMWYRAPELFFGLKNYTTNIDIWSLGCVLAEFMIGKPLFGHCQTEKQELQNIFELMGTPDECEWQQVQKLQNYQMYKPQFSRESGIIFHLKKVAREYEEQNLLLDLIQKMLRLNPYSRYSATECLAHDFFNVNYEEQALLPEFIVEKKMKADRAQDHVSKKPKYN